MSHIKRNGHTYYGKQNYRCKNCGRQFVENSQLIDEEKKDSLPDDLNFDISQAQNRVIQLLVLDVEADEMWSFVASKDNKQWVWIAIDIETRQIIAFYVGDRSHNSAQQLWDRIPETYRKHARFTTDAWEAYQLVIPASQHDVCDKGSGRTNIIERFNCTLRQRVSRLVRDTLSFSKIISNHIGAIEYFICHYNLAVTGRT